MTSPTALKSQRCLLPPLPPMTSPRALRPFPTLLAVEAAEEAAEAVAEAAAVVSLEAAQAEAAAPLT